MDFYIYVAFADTLELFYSYNTNHWMLFWW